MGKKILVIVVTYNAEKWIDYFLTPLYGSSLVDVLCIDNNSSDSTCEILRSNFPDTELIKNERNMGFGKANNIGLNRFLRSIYESVFLLNQDARIEEKELIKLVKILRENPEYGILSPVQRSNQDSRLDYYFSLYLNEQNTPGLMNDLILGNNLKVVYGTKFVNAALWAMSRDCIDKVGLFDPIYPHYGEDDDYAKRVAKAGLKIGVVPTIFANHARKDPREVKKIATFGDYKNKHYVSLLVYYKHIDGGKLRKLLILLRDFIGTTVQATLTLDFHSLRLAVINYIKVAVKIVANDI